jgi:hypothetical protein
MIALVCVAIFSSTSDLEGCRRYRQEPALVVTSVAPGGVVVLGSDFKLQYRIAPGVEFTGVKLQVANKKGELVYVGEKLPARPGNHEAVWPKGKWNQEPHPGALANPRNGPYAVALIAESPSGGSIAYRIFQDTQLVLECDLFHDRPSKDEISSGLSRAMLDRNSPERLRVGLVRKGSKLADTVYAPAPPDFSAIVEEDLDNDPSELEIKSLHVRQVMPSTFSDGIYNVVFTNARTGAGQSLPDDGIVDSWVVNLR